MRRLIEVSDDDEDGALVDGDRYEYISSVIRVQTQDSQPSMYPEDGLKSALFSRKRPFPVTPPLSTRRATAETLSTSIGCVNLSFL